MGLAEDLSFQWGRFRQPEMVLGLWDRGWKVLEQLQCSVYSREETIPASNDSASPGSSSLSGCCLRESRFIPFLESTPQTCDPILIPFHLPARSWIHFYNSKLLFWVLRIGLPKCGCRISWFIWVAWFVPISSTNSSRGIGCRGGRCQKGSTKCFISKSQVAAGWCL